MPEWLRRSGSSTELSTPPVFQEDCSISEIVAKAFPEAG